MQLLSDFHTHMFGCGNEKEEFHVWQQFISIYSLNDVDFFICLLVFFFRCPLVFFFCIRILLGLPYINQMSNREAMASINHIFQ